MINISAFVSQMKISFNRKEAFFVYFFNVYIIQFVKLLRFFGYILSYYQVNLVIDYPDLKIKGNLIIQKSFNQFNLSPLIYRLLIIYFSFRQEFLNIV
jgi:hypothetical protein